MKITIITVCKNAESSIEKTILSVINQSYQNIEYIVIDGKSSDNTVKIIKKYEKDIALFKSESDNGLYNAMNKALKYSNGDFIFFLNSDDLFISDKTVELVVSKIDNKDIDLIIGDILFLSNDNGKVYLNENYFCDRLQFIQGSITQQSFFYNKNVFKKTGDFNEKLKICGDYDWFLRAFFKNIKVKCKFLHFPFVLFSTGGLSTDFTYKKLHKKERVKLIKIYFNFFERIIYGNKLMKFLFFIRPVIISSIKRFISGTVKIVKGYHI